MDAGDIIAGFFFFIGFVLLLIWASSREEFPAHPLCGVELPACADWAGDGSGLVCVPVTFPCEDAGL